MLDNEAPLQQRADGDTPSGLLEFLDLGIVLQQNFPRQPIDMPTGDHTFLSLKRLVGGYPSDEVVYSFLSPTT